MRKSELRDMLATALKVMHTQSMLLDLMASKLAAARTEIDTYLQRSPAIRN